MQKQYFQLLKKSTEYSNLWKLYFQELLFLVMLLRVLKKAPHLCAINISQCPGAGSSAPQLYTISTALHEQYKSLRAWHLPALTNNQTLCISTFDWLHVNTPLWQWKMIPCKLDKCQLVQFGSSNFRGWHYLRAVTTMLTGFWRPWLKTKDYFPKVENFSTCLRTKVFEITSLRTKTMILDRELNLLA